MQCAFRLFINHQSITVMSLPKYTYTEIVNGSYERSLRNNRMRGMDAEQAFSGQGWPLKALGFSLTE